MSDNTQCISKHLSNRQLQGVLKIGDVLLPGGDGLLSFSQSNQIIHIDRILDYMPAPDTKDLGMLLSFLGILPGSFLCALWWLIDSSYRWPGNIGATLRLIRISLRGLILSLYFSEGPALDAMGYKVSVYTADM
jgi:hypothetical protein